jgi:hypothetical protein
VALILRSAAASIVIACGSWSGPQEPLFPTGDDIVVVLRQPGTLPVLAPFLRDGQPALPLPGADASVALRAGVRHRSVSYADRRQSLPVIPSAAA